MDTQLKASQDTIISLFAALRTPRDVAKLLEVPYGLLIYHLHKTPPSTRYISFAIRKRAGGERIISAPGTALKILQIKLNYVLKTVYRPNSCIYGFIVNGGIVKNASVHANRRLVFNLDLKDFFPSIHFGRVKGMFSSPPYNCPSEVSTVLAQICCLPKTYPSLAPYAQLPQGAPTSPIVSNMVCSSLDSQLLRLAKKYKCSYSRYADDITFSTNLPRFHEAILVESQAEEGRISVTAGSELKAIISSNTFRINENKVRLQRAMQRQSVTGLTTNKFPNPPRRLIRQIRAILHAWTKYGYENAQNEFRSRYFNRTRNPNKMAPELKHVLHGKINYVGMVRGQTDPLYLSYLKQLKALAPELIIRQVIDVMDALWVLESDGAYAQGTGFSLKGYGIVTCYHVLRARTKLFKANTPAKKYNIEVIIQDQELDIAVLATDGPQGPELLLEEGERPRQDDWILLTGYPSYSAHATGVVRRGRVTGYYQFFGTERMLIDTPIVYGNSGGPVLNQSNKVVGIAAKGPVSLNDAQKTEKFEVIPISILRRLAPPAPTAQ
ncbi:RNA-directed DNA polymerase (modular protein) [Nitrospira japonica]|uniref:RNA-directed DNA polymerase n=1 Tax=Nitrospira japonica TaxID=1325564 RepID=A0A1W1IA74_9BACT|nr:trypsin-like peptidase domain-containing protein [Nitrospira japonica]SLM49947.1 RNA-directed DNA polymerase (modular protein) [Nitrospira japonica]